MPHEILHPSGQSAIYEPFSSKTGLGWLNQRVAEGYFGPTASYDRSRGMEQSFNLTSLESIKNLKGEYSALLTDPQKQKEQPNRLPLRYEGPDAVGQVDWNKDLQLKLLREEWDSIPKGGEEELRWAEKTVALAAAGFEDFRHRRGDTGFGLRDNQLYDMAVLLLSKGSYSFGKLETESRGTEMHTGEGKTFCTGLLAPMLAQQGGEEKIVVIEPSYISAKNHAEQMAPFYEEFYHVGTGVATGVAEREGRVQKQIFNTQGILENVTVSTGGFKSYRYLGGSLIEDPGSPGRKNAWSQKIVYVDSDALAFDWLADHQIGKKNQTGQPDLGKVTFLPSEADQLLLDMARNAYIVSEKLPASEVWGAVGDAVGLTSVYPEGWSDADKNAVTQRAVFSIWGNLYEARRRGDFKEGYGQDYMIIDKQLVSSERLQAKAFNIVAQALAPTFGYNPQREEARIDEFVHGWNGQDLQDSSMWNDAIRKLRQIYVFGESKSEGDLRALFAKGLPPNVLASGIKDILREDHNRTVWSRAAPLLNGAHPLSERGPHDPAKDEALVDNFVNGMGGLDLVDREASQDSVIEGLRKAYYFREPESEKKLRALLSRGIPRNLISLRIKDILREDHARCVIDQTNSDNPNPVPVFTKELAFLHEDNAGAIADIAAWLNNNSGVVSAAMDQLFGMKSQVDFIGGKKPVLLDEYGFPLERRQLQDMSQVFLQMNNFWEQGNMGAQALTPDTLWGMEQKHAQAIEMSRTVNRITIPSLMNRAKRMRFSSGSLIPAADSFSRLYGAEVLSVSRHLEIPDQIRSRPDSVLDAGASVGGTFGYNRELEQSQIRQAVRQWLDHPGHFMESLEDRSRADAASALRTLYPTFDARTETRLSEAFSQNLPREILAGRLENILWQDHMQRVWREMRRYAQEKTVPSPGELAKRLPFLSAQSRKSLEDASRWAAAHPDMADVAYEAIFGASFREDFKEPSLVTRCLDGGLAKVKFVGSPQREFIEFQRKAAEIKAAGNMGLFIVPDIETARRLQNSLKGVDVSLATGAQELTRRGSLDRAASSGAPGRVIITTWIAHRDVDVHMPASVLENGGLDCVVSGNAPTERGLWQALARSLRGDLPGSRTLLLSPADFTDIQNRDITAGQMGVIHRPPKKVHEEKVKEIQSKWTEALAGNKKAMTDLFTTHLSSLRSREEMMKMQLVRTLIRDADLEKWQEMFVESRGRLSEEMNEYMTSLEEDMIGKMIKEYDLGALPSDINRVPTGGTSGRLNTVLKKLEAHMGYIPPKEQATRLISDSARDQALQRAWGEFLRFLDVEVAVYLTNQDVKKLTPDLQRASFASHVEDILSGMYAPESVSV